MKKLLLALFLFFAPSIAWAQCNGVFGASTVCGSVGGGIPGPIPFSSINVPGGTSGQIQWNNGGAFGGFTMGGDCTVTTSTGIEICTKTNGVPFAASATTDTTNASNIGTGSLSLPRIANLGADSILANFTGAGAPGTSQALPNCTGSASGLGYNTATHAIGCNAITTGSVAGTILVTAAPYNAACNGSTDDTSAINSAITAALAVNGGTTIQFPNATCKITGTLNVGAYTGSGAAKIRLQGTGWGSIISCTAATTCIAVAITPAGNTFEMNNLQLVQTNAASVGMTWTSTNISRCIFCRITGGKNNLTITTSFATVIQNSLFGGTTNEAVIYGSAGSPGTDASCNASVFNYNGVYSTSGSVASAAVLVHGACQGFTMIGNDIETGSTGLQTDSGVRNALIHGNYFESFTSTPIFFGPAAGSSYIDVVGNAFIMHTNPGVTLFGDHIHFDNNVINDFSMSFAGVSFLELGNNNLTGGAVITNANWNAFTPSFSCGTATFTVNAANYQKIGNTTSLTVDATISALGTCAAGGMTFTLPTTPVGSAAMSGRENVNTADAISCAVPGAATSMGCSKGGAAVAWTAGDRIIIGGVYQNQ